MLNESWIDSHRRHWRTMTNWQRFCANFRMMIGMTILGWALDLLHKHSSLKTNWIFSELAKSLEHDSSIEEIKIITNS